MNDASDERESWTLEVILCFLVGLPWYGFSANIPIAFAVHAVLVVFLLVMELGLFGRGSAIMSFLFVLVFSVLIGLVAVGVNAGRLFD